MSATRAARSDSQSAITRACSVSSASRNPGWRPASAWPTSVFHEHGSPLSVTNESAYSAQPAARAAASPSSHRSRACAAGADCFGVPSAAMTRSAAHNSCSCDACSRGQHTARARISASVWSAPSAARWAAITWASGRASNAARRSRLSMMPRTSLSNWNSAARPAIRVSAARPASIACARLAAMPVGSRSSPSTASSASRRAASACASSISRKCGEICASSGNRRSSDWQKAWMVPTRIPPGRSSTRANKALACARAASVGVTSSARSRSSSAASGSVTHCPSTACSRNAISAAAARV